MEKASGGSFARTTRETAEDEEEDRDMTLNTYKSRAFVRDFFSGVVIRSRAQAVCPGGKDIRWSGTVVFSFRQTTSVMIRAGE